MTGQPPRDWDKELAEIDRLIARTPAAEPAKPVAAPGPARPAARPPARASRRERWGTWARVGLATMFAAAVTQWPYAHSCGSGLFLYLGVVGVAGLASIWAARVSWSRRQGWAHVVSLLIGLWAAGLVAAAVLPRIGYARESLSWFC